MRWLNRAIADRGWHPAWICVGLLLVAIAAAYVLLLTKSYDLLVSLPAKPSSDAAGKLKEAYETAQAVRSAQLGQMGDFAGGLLNPILTFLSTAGLLVTIVIAANQLREARRISAEQHRLDRTATRVAALTALLDAATSQLREAATADIDQSGYDAVLRYQGAILQLLQDLHAELHAIDAPDIPLPTELRPVRRRRREGFEI